MSRRKPKPMGGGFWGNGAGELLEAVLWGVFFAVVVLGAAALGEHYVG